MKLKRPNREKYCRFCGRELELGRCYCDEFIASKAKAKEKTKTMTCDTCGAKIDADSVYCAYCGMPLLVDGNNKELQKELRGENAKDVIKVYANEMNPKDRFLFPLSFVISISVATLFVGILFGYLIIPEIRKAIFNYNFYRQAEMNDDLYNNPESNAEEMIEESTDINYDAETAEGNLPDEGPVASEVIEPTSQSKSSKESSTNSTSTSSSVGANTASSSTTVGASYASPSESTKKNTLWLEKATRVDDTIGSGANACQLLFYYPVINGENAEEVKLLGDLFQYVFYADFITQVKNYATSQVELPTSIYFEVPKDQGGSGKIYRVKFVGHVTPRVGVAGTIRYTIIYNRETNDIRVQKTN